MYRLGDCQAQPPEKSRALHALHHQHHTGNKRIVAQLMPLEDSAAASV